MSDMGHHGGHMMHSGYGGDGFGISHNFDLQGAQSQGFLSHLFGTDGIDHQHAGHGIGHHIPVDQTPQGSVSWTSALRSVKPSDVLQGLTITNNVWLLIMFFGFFAWLAVVYFVRHNEPLANTVLGTGGAYSTTALADRQLVAGMKNAVPIRTGSSTGAVYVPNSGIDSLPLNQSGASAACPPPAGSFAPGLSGDPGATVRVPVQPSYAQANAPEAYGTPSAQPANVPPAYAPPAYAPPPAAYGYTPEGAQYGYGQGAMPQANMQYMQAMPQATAPMALPQVAGSVTGAYLAPVQTQEGCRYRVFTSR